jgi:REP element-mobilizing transposase RayT
MVLGYHVIFGAYGFWLPNDPRGSWSDYVGAWELLRFGPATKTTETRSLAHHDHDRVRRLAAKKALQYPAVEFSGVQARAIAQGFANYLARSKLQIWACAILPEHVHLVVGRCHLKIEQVVIQLKSAATERLIETESHPFQQILLPNGRRPKCFARGQWAPFLQSAEDILRAIHYVEQNPVKEGKKRQAWSFVTRPEHTLADVIELPS